MLLEALTLELQKCVWLQLIHTSSFTATFTCDVGAAGGKSTAIAIILWSEEDSVPPYTYNYENISVKPIYYSFSYRRSRVRIHMFVALLSFRGT